MANKILRGFNSIVITNMKLLIKKFVLRRRIDFSFIHVMHSSTKVDVGRKGWLHLGKMINISQSTLTVRDGAVLDIQDRVFMNAGVTVTCREKITIGENTLLGHNVLIYDHDHQKISSGGVDRKEFITKPVSIGKNCWIGAGTIILKGTEVGENSIVGAGCVLNGVYPENSVIVQKRETSIIPKSNSTMIGA